MELPQEMIRIASLLCPLSCLASAYCYRQTAEVNWSLEQSQITQMDLQLWREAMAETKETSAHISLWYKLCRTNLCHQEQGALWLNHT